MTVVMESFPPSIFHRIIDKRGLADMPMRILPVRWSACSPGIASIPLEFSHQLRV